MGEDEYSININCVLAVYMDYRLNKDAFNRPNSQNNHFHGNKVTTTIQKLCDEFETRYGKQISEMCHDCGVLDLNRDSYTEVLKQLIYTDIHWGRVVAMITFAGAMAVHCKQYEDEEKIDLIREWTCSFMSTHVERWINNNNGWKGIVKFYEDGLPKTEKAKGWGSLLLTGALGAVAFGAMVIHKGVI